MCITQTHWRLIGWTLPYVNRGPWVVREGRRERAVKITVDEFLCPAIEAWKAGKPFAKIIYDLPRSEVARILAYKSMTYFHAYLDIDAKGYSLESELEVDLENDEYEFRQDDRLLTFFGHPHLPVV